MDNRDVLAVQKWIETGVPWDQLEEPSDTLLNPKQNSQLAIATALLLAAAHAFLTKVLDAGEGGSSTHLESLDWDELEDVLRFGFPLLSAVTDTIVWVAKEEESPWKAIAKDKRTFDFEARELKPRQASRIFWGFIKELTTTDRDDWDILITQVLRSIITDPHVQCVTGHIATAVYLKFYFWNDAARCEEKVRKWRNLAAHLATIAEDSQCSSDDLSREIERMFDPEVPHLLFLQSCFSKAWPNQKIFYGSDYAFFLYDDAIAPGSRKDLFGKASIESVKESWTIAFEQVNLVEEMRMHEEFKRELRYAKRVAKALTG